MARPTLLLALAAGLLLLLSTLHLVSRFGRLDWSLPWFATISHDQPGNHDPSTQTFSGGDGTEYLLGVGKGDITGPVVEINFMGYADTSQLGTGVRQRLYSRAFIVGDLDDPVDRFVYLVLDTQSGDTAVRHGILEAVEALGHEYAMYGQQNIAVTGTHSHSGPGAWLNYLLPQITSKGFHKPSYQAIVDGAVASIVRAHGSLARGRLSIGDINISDANVNQSPYAYLANPEEERARYEDDVDKTLTLLRFTHTLGSTATDIGVLTWFPVHGTSMYGNNTLVTGDNKGVAAYMFEQATEDDAFVAGFSQASVGDTTPNVLGAYCEFGDYAGQLCDFKTSLCGNKTQPCHGRGPYWNLNDGGAASSFEIGRRQFDAAWRLLHTDSAFTPVRGGVVKSSHRFVDFSNLSFDLPNGAVARTCPAALGHSFAAGTSDGPGAFDFKQAQPGDPHTNPLWSLIGNRVHKPNETQIACHGAKPILLDVGESADPYAWAPNIVDIQLLRVGQLFVIVSPGEATTMAGRRWRESLTYAAMKTFSDLQSAGTPPVAVIGGPANSYTHYITTEEEYSVQRYEGASTLYGPHTLAAYIQQTVDSLSALSASSISNPRLTRGLPPPINTNASLSFITGVIVDRAGLFKSFGDVVQDISPRYHAGASIEAVFVGANPRNDHRPDRTFAAVEQLNEATGMWSQIRDDRDWSLVFQWRRTSTILGTSEVVVSWETSWETGAWRREGVGAGKTELMVRTAQTSLAGTYRLVYYGDAKVFGGEIKAFQGVSGQFVISD